MVHFRIAEGILRAAQERAKETLGVELDVGEFPSIKESGVESDDPQRIVELTAHAVARAGDKFKFLRRVSRHLEGKGNRAGILSDISAVLVALYKRNPKVFETLGRQFYADLQFRRAAQQASSNGGTSPSQPQTRGVTPDVEA